ncbi:MAG: ornithine carbamoyltransferase, partial [Thermoprotei archaeon]
MVNLYGRDLLSISDLTAEEIWAILETAYELKLRHKRGEKVRVLDGKTVAMIFKKPSTRTRLSFQVAVAQLGGQAFYMRPSEMQLSRGESIKDTAMVID